ncbi:MAG: universal stress protein [Dissulfurimicrobium sp.]|uniref:universal stress protein n=1 Tax=Dissulfurimicrobium TaxID=1769732 RepID=UPI003C76B8C1
MEISMILIPVDFSDCAKNSIIYAKNFVKIWKADVILIYVINSKYAEHIAEYIKEPIEKVKDRLINQAKQSFRNFLSQLSENNFIKDTIVSYGRPFQEIAIKARELQADMIIMGGYGSMGIGQIDEIFFGSTVEKVIRLLPCPIICVPMGWTVNKT